MVELPHQIEGALLHQLDLHGDVVNLMNVDGQKDLEHLKKMDNLFGFENISFGIVCFSVSSDFLRSTQKYSQSSSFLGNVQSMRKIFSNFVCFSESPNL